MSNTNWDHAPQDATHAGTMEDTDYQCWYRIDGNQYFYWYSENGLLETKGWDEVGGVPYHEPLIPRPDVTWVPGESLPPVGMKVALVRDQLASNTTLYKIDNYAGDEVEIVSHVKANHGTDLALYKFNVPGGIMVKQGIAAIFTSLENVAKVKADKKIREDLKSLHDEFGIIVGTVPSKLLEDLYKSGRITA